MGPGEWVHPLFRWWLADARALWVERPPACDLWWFCVACCQVRLADSSRFLCIHAFAIHYSLAMRNRIMNNFLFIICFSFSLCQ